jgi:transcription antitermination factor NusA-like protein
MNAIERVKELINELGCAVEVLRWDEDLKKYVGIEPCEIEDEEIVEDEIIDGFWATVMVA